MGIWIRSQDKQRLIYCNEMIIDSRKKITNEFIIITKYINCGHESFLLLGAYKTNEKALKVLDDIQFKLEDNDERIIQIPQDDEVNP